VLEALVFAAWKKCWSVPIPKNRRLKSLFLLPGKNSGLSPISAPLGYDGAEKIAFQHSPVFRPQSLRIALWAVAGLWLSACSLFAPSDLADIPLKAVAHVDLDRYMGRWYIIANIPYFAERGNKAPHVDYSLRKDGLIDDIYTAQDEFDQAPFVKKGMIEVTDKVHFAEGRITFLPPLWQDYSVLYLDPDYRFTVIGHPSRDYAWVFAREPDISDEQYKKMLAALADNRFDVNRVLRIPQTAAQLGAPGFQ
jgi:apolipoprotein D and lipocalin family protein